MARNSLTHYLSRLGVRTKAADSAPAVAADEGYTFENTAATRGKGLKGDATASQSIRDPKILTPQQCISLYEGNLFCQAVVDSEAEDLTREGWFVEFPEDEELTDHVNARMHDLNVQGVLAEMCRDEGIFGDGFVSLGILGGDASPGKPVESPKGLDYLHHVPYLSVAAAKNWKINGDPTTKGFGKVEAYPILIAGQNDPTPVHADRVLHYQTRPRRKEAGGLSKYQTLWRMAQILENGAWSIGQVMNYLVFKVYKAKGWAGMKDNLREELRDALRAEVDQDLSTSTSWIIDVDEDLGLLASISGLGALQSLTDVIWEIASLGTRTPKSHLVGQPQGQLTAASFDSRRYYARIHGLQVNKIKPLLIRVVDLLIREAKKDPEETTYEITFNPLLTLDEKEQAELEKIRAEAAQVWIANDVLLPDEVRQEVHGKGALSGELEPKTKAPEPPAAEPAPTQTPQVAGAVDG